MAIGSIIDLTIKKETVSEAPAPQESSDAEGKEKEENVDGLEHEATVQQSYIVDTYSIKHLVIADILNEEGESLYQYYMRYMSIPVGERSDYLEKVLRKDDSLLEKVKPARAVIGVSTEQKTKLGDLTADNVTLEVSFTGEKDVGNEKKKAFFDDAATFKDLLESFREKLESESNNEGSSTEAN